MERKAAILKHYITLLRKAKFINDEGNRLVDPRDYALSKMPLLTEKERLWLNCESAEANLAEVTHRIEDLPLGGIIIPRIERQEIPRFYDYDIGSGDCVLIGDKTHEIVGGDYSVVFQKPYRVYPFKPKDEDTEP